MENGTPVTFRWSSARLSRRRRVLGWAQEGCGAGRTIGGSTFRRAGSQGGRGERPGRGAPRKKSVVRPARHPAAQQPRPRVLPDRVVLALRGL
eukprot:scaffold100445_cov37-Phaeocystis_antarctica.AAC.1